MTEEEIWKFYAMETKDYRKMLQSGEISKKLLDDLLDDSIIIDKCGNKKVRIGSEYQASVPKKKKKSLEITCK
jgi:hypothetical protein